MSRLLVCVAAMLVLAAGSHGRAFAPERQASSSAPAQQAAAGDEVSVGDFRIAEPMESQVQKKDTSDVGGLVVTKRESKGVVSYSTAEDAKNAPNDQRSFGGSLYGSGYSK
jgi:hypothetical protein